MGGIVGFLDRRGTSRPVAGAVVVKLLLGLRPGPFDAFGAAVERLADGQAGEKELEPGVWRVRLAPTDTAAMLEPLEKHGQIFWSFPEGQTRAVGFRPKPGVTPSTLAAAVAKRDLGHAVIGCGRSIDVIKHAGPWEGLDAAFGLGRWRGGHAIAAAETFGGGPRSAEAPVRWVRGALDAAIALHGPLANATGLGRMLRQDRPDALPADPAPADLVAALIGRGLTEGATLEEATTRALDWLDGPVVVLALDASGLVAARGRSGPARLLVQQTDEYAAVATRESAFRGGLPGALAPESIAPGRVLAWPSVPPEARHVAP